MSRNRSAHASILLTDDRDRLHSLTQYELVTESLNELYGEENPSEWIKHIPATDETEKKENERSS